MTSFKENLRKYLTNQPLSKREEFFQERVWPVMQYVKNSRLSHECGLVTLMKRKAVKTLADYQAQCTSTCTWELITNISHA